MAGGEGGVEVECQSMADRHLGLVLFTSFHMDERRNEKSNVTDLIP